MIAIKKFSLIVYIVFFCVPFTAWLQNDILDTAFQQSKNLDQVINIGNNKNAVGNEIFRGSTNINGVELNANDPLASKVHTSEKAPLLVRITQTLLRLTIALSIPALIWIGIKVIKSWLEGGNVKEAMKEISWVLIWLALALSAVGIIYLIQSITTQSLSL
jgi:hypothetical protein